MHATAYSGPFYAIACKLNMCDVSGSTEKRKFLPSRQTTSQITDTVYPLNFPSKRELFDR